MALLNLGGIEEATVMAQQRATGDQRLVGYIVPNRWPAPSTGELRRALSQVLPSYKVPSVFLVLDEFPRAPNGKLDRRALPAPTKDRPRLESDFIAPRNPAEEKLANIWAEVLDLDEVGIHDHFLELGGDSLLASQVISRVISTFSVEVPLQLLFEAPTVADLAVLIVQNQGKKAEQSNLERRQMESVSSHTEDKQRISPRGESPLLPSFSQQRLWFLNQLEPDSSIYNVPVAFRLTGPLNVAALEQSLNEISRRHEALRTTFSVVDGQPAQVIAPKLNLTLPVLDLRELTEIERDAEVQRLVVEEAQAPFDLAQGPLLRASLLRLGQEEHVLMLTMHHVVSDGWSLNVLFRETTTLYQAFSTGEPSPVPELPIQYADFALWQRQWLQGEELESQLAYWKEQLDGIPPVLELPTDRPRPAVETFRGAKQSLFLPKSLTQSLKSLSQEEGVTLFMTLLAAFQTLLHRYTGLDDIVVGSPIAGRKQVETEELIGFFVNTLVLRTNLSGEPTFRELLRRVREVALKAYDHQDLPFEKLVEELHPERNLSHSPLFQVMFVLQNTPKQVLELPGLSLSSLEVESGTAKFDLTLSMTETELGMQGSLEYKTDLFDTSTIQRMLGHFQILLESIAANPDRSISDLPLLTDAEQHQLLIEWNDTKADYPDQCIHQLFEAQVERTPDAVAVVFGTERLTYHELNRRANQLAHYLRSLGVGPEVLVGICLERSLEMVVGLLGILKAGGAYVPLDPEYPKERLAFMLEDAQVSVLLTQEQLQEGLGECEAQVVCLDSGWEVISQERARRSSPVEGAGQRFGTM